MKAPSRKNSNRAAALAAWIALAASPWATARAQEPAPSDSPAAEAEEALLNAVRRSEQAPADPASLGTSLRNLGIFYQTRGRGDDARPLLERALAVRQKALGRAHPDVVQSLDDLALLAVGTGDVASAEQLYKRVLRGQRKLYGHDDIRTAITINNLALLNANRGELRRAAALYREELALLETAYGSDSVRLVTTLETLGRLAVEQGDTPEAEALYRRAIALAESSSAPASTRRLIDLLDRYAALLAVEPERAADAEAVAQRAAELRTRPPSVDRRIGTD